MNLELETADWIASDEVAVAADRTLVLSKGFDPAPGSERGLVSARPYRDIQLNFLVRLDGAACFVAKLLQQTQHDPCSNSYHLYSQPGSSYLARHRTILGSVELPRGVWLEVCFRRRGNRVAWYADGTDFLLVTDDFLVSGYCFLGVKGGHVELRSIELTDLTDATHQLVPGDTSSRRASRVQHLPFARMPRRNLIYQIWPVQDSNWQWNLDQLLRRIDLFNGQRLIGIVHDEQSEHPRAVQDYLSGHGCDFVLRPHHPAGGADTFLDLIERVSSLEPDEITFYAHALGVEHGPAIPESVIQWATAMYRTNLDDWCSVREQLESKAMTGAFRMLGSLPSASGVGVWYYSGAFFWMRHVYVFGRDFGSVPSSSGGVEAWPATLFDLDETGCLFMDRGTQAPWGEGFWELTGTPALQQWASAIRQIRRPDDLREPAPLDAYEFPRVVQKHDELRWWIDQMLMHGVRSVLTIGVYQGGVEWHTARIFRELNIDVRITSIDICPTSAAWTAFQSARDQFGQEMILLEGDSASAAIRQQLRDHYDAVFIDGDHSYAHAHADWVLAKSLRPRMIGFHDIVDSDLHVDFGCCVSRLWEQIRAKYRTRQCAVGDWGGIGIAFFF